MDIDTPEEELELVERAQKGDRAALERLLLGNYDRLYRIIDRKLPSSLRRIVATEDVLQQTFAQIFRDIERFEPRGEGSFQAWVATIADHRFQDAIKAHRRKKRGGDLRRVEVEQNAHGSLLMLFDVIAADDPRASQAMRREEAVQALQVAIAALPDDQRRATEIHHLDGLSLEETAEAMERSVGSVRGLLQRAKVTLKDAMGRASQWLGRDDIA